MFLAPTHVDERNAPAHLTDSLKRAKTHYSEKDVGNDVPAGLTEIKEAELVKATHFSGQIPTLIEHRSFPLVGNDGKTYHTSAVLYHYYDGTGVAMVTDYWTAPHVRWFRFGCKHEYVDGTEEARKRGVTMYRCDHASLCTKCGHFQVVDSSD